MLYDKLDKLRNEKEALRQEWKITVKNRNIEQEVLDSAKSYSVHLLSGGAHESGEI